MVDPVCPEKMTERFDLRLGSVHKVLKIYRLIFMFASSYTPFIDYTENALISSSLPVGVNGLQSYVH